MENSYIYLLFWAFIFEFLSNIQAHVLSKDFREDLHDR